MTLIEEPRQGSGCVFGKERWSIQEWTRVKDLIGRGHSLDSIALMVGRSKEQLKGKIRWENMSEEKREERRARINAYRQQQRDKPVRPRTVAAILRKDPPDEALLERRLRLSAPRTLTGAFFGDPPIGFSALERKQPEYIDHRLAQLQRRPSLATLP